MILADTRIIKPHNELYAELDNLCFLSKNLYNSTLFVARRSFLLKNYRNYNSINKEFTHSDQPDYRALPAKVAKQTQMLVDKNFKSFFALCKTKKAGRNSTVKKVRLPDYLHKVEGRQVVVYPKDALSFAKDGYIRLSKTNVFIKNFVDKKDVRQVRVVPCNGYIKIEILYKKECREHVGTQKYAAIDLGIDNLATLTSTEFSPVIVNGKPAKSINRFYNKLIAQEKATIALTGHTKSAELSNMWRRRKARLDDYLHKSSRHIVNHLVNHSISHLIVGYNKRWKQDTKMGKVNNQRFVYMPFQRFVEMLTYKCALEGITVVLQEESYTSKSSFLDDDPIPVYGKTERPVFAGKRVKRGLYKTGAGQLVNADVNGSLNILRKYAIGSDLWCDGVRQELVNHAHNPVRVTM